MSSEDETIVRYNASERINHWIVAITFFLAALSGLALFHPSLFFLTDLFGGGPWTRILHPWTGIVMVVAFALMARWMWRDNYLNESDRRWLFQIWDVIGNREERLPPVGRYNAGQKVLFWVLVVSLALLLLTGLVIWYAYFALLFPLWLRQAAAVIHALAAFVLVEGIIVHIYASIWVKGSIHAMVSGKVTPAWARQHHPEWYREISTGKA